MQQPAERRLQIPLTQFMTLILATVLAASVFNFALTTVKSYRLRYVEAELRAAIRAEQEEHQRLLARKAFIESERYQRQLAHEMGLYDNQERPLVLIIPAGQESDYKETDPVFRPGRKLEKPYWQQWWDLFFGEDILEEINP
jgi:hypothetical protein